MQSKNKSTAKTNTAIVSSLLLTQLAAAAMMLAPLASQAHGSLEVPLSRERHCLAELRKNSDKPISEACTAAFQKTGTGPFYDWTANLHGGHIEDQSKTIPNGLLCAGGNQNRAGLDVPGNWTTTKIAPDANGKYVAKYLQTAGHMTQYFRTYLTKDSYDFSRPMTWDDMILVGDTGKLPNPGSNTITNLELKIPAGMTGRRVMYTAWQRDPADNAETFYACADVVIAGATTTWHTLTKLEFYDRPANSTMTLRVFDSGGHDIERHSIQIAAGKTSGSAIALAMADKVNATSQVVRIGALDNKGNITVVADATKNNAYAKDGTYTVALQMEDSTNVTPDPIINRPPVAMIMGPNNISVGNRATFDATSSADPDNDPLTYSWKFPAELIPCCKDAMKSGAASFIAPSLTKDTTFTIEVTVSDGEASSVARHVVIVNKDPTTKIDDPVIDDGSKEFPSYKAGTVYKGGEQVKTSTGIYECRQFPFSGWCGQAEAAYAPGTGWAWNDAWIKVGN